jgi:hypothetical protein
MFDRWMESHGVSNEFTLASMTGRTTESASISNTGLPVSDVDPAEYTSLYVRALRASLAMQDLRIQPDQSFSAFVGLGKAGARQPCVSMTLSAMEGRGKWDTPSARFETDSETQTRALRDYG